MINAACVAHLSTISTMQYCAFGTIKYLLPSKNKVNLYEYTSIIFGKNSYNVNVFTCCKLILLKRNM